MGIKNKQNVKQKLKAKKCTLFLAIDFIYTSFNVMFNAFDPSF